ncbi:hypothetical protein KQ876_01050 [Mycoplasma sp. CSL7491-lung]|uniref:hypothetical protein n=1 Tax=Mycoplasma sp. CSL7491-lung TaxID=549718 RepID=UPI001C0FEFBB|nr:hypothetical protein [Mycoplasma sp. CSL7491-lung]MBU4692792.1 hypothetical protein [Mycoplasma sp. CSL7491-lung]
MKKWKFILGTLIPSMTSSLVFAVSCNANEQNNKKADDPEVIYNKSTVQLNNENNVQSINELKNQNSLQANTLIEEIQKGIEKLNEIIDNEIQQLNEKDKVDEHSYRISENSKFLKFYAIKSNNGNSEVHIINENILQYIKSFKNSFVSVAKDAQVKENVKLIIENVLSIFSDLTISLGFSAKETKEIISYEILPILKEILDVEKTLQKANNLLELYNSFKLGINTSMQNPMFIIDKLKDFLGISETLERLKNMYLSVFKRQPKIKELIIKEQIKDSDIEASISSLFTPKPGKNSEEINQKIMVIRGILGKLYSYNRESNGTTSFRFNSLNQNDKQLLVNNFKDLLVINNNFIGSNEFKGEIANYFAGVIENIANKNQIPQKINTILDLFDSIKNRVSQILFSSRNA